MVLYHPRLIYTYIHTNIHYLLEESMDLFVFFFFVKTEKMKFYVGPEGAKSRNEYNPYLCFNLIILSAIVSVENEIV